MLLVVLLHLLVLLLLLDGGVEVSGGGGVVGLSDGQGGFRRRCDVDGEAVGRHPVLVVVVLDRVLDLGLHRAVAAAARRLPLGDHGGPGGVGEGAVEAVGHERQRARRRPGHLWTQGENKVASAFLPFCFELFSLLRTLLIALLDTYHIELAT